MTRRFPFSPSADRARPSPTDGASEEATPRAVGRRAVLQGGLGLAAAAGFVAARPAAPHAQTGPSQPAPVPSGADDGAWRHGLSLLGEPKQPPEFRRFAYVNPDAPKGGVAREAAQGTFDSFNLAVAGLRGDVEGRVALLYDRLMAPSLDEVATEYGLLAEAVRVAPDLSSVTFRLRREARWHDRAPVTAEDVVFSFDVLKANNPQEAFYYRHVTKAEAIGPHEVRFTFDERGNRELPQIVGQFPVFPKHWWTGKDAEGRQRDVTQSSLEPPLGSGPYRVKSFVAGRSAVYERVPDYWGRDLPVNVGQHNFDELRVEYFRDATVLLEAFKGDAFDFRRENSARNWSQGYDGPALREGRIVKEEFPQRAIGVMQAFVPNARRAKLADGRVRRALNLAFDFEELNRTNFFGLYERVTSYFHGTELAATGTPAGAELALLEPFRAQLPPALFREPYANPPAGDVRANLREAVRLLGEAGFTIRNGRMVSAGGEPLAIELLTSNATDERFALPYRAALGRIGVDLSLRVVDPPQYLNRVRAFDFDMVTTVWAQSLSPGNEQRNFWGSEAADRPGSRNLAGIKDPIVDALIEKIIFAPDRETLVAATRAMDRVLLWRNHVIPQWTSGLERTARWDRFARPETLPAYGASAFPTVWWWDDARVARTGLPR